MSSSQDGLGVEDARALVPLPRVGDKVGRFRVQSEVAAGGMAVVYAARSEFRGGSGRPVALKVLLPSLAIDPALSSSFLEEGRIASHIEHPNVVELLDVFEDAGRMVLVMELLRGRSLSQLHARALRAGTPLPLGALFSGLAACAEGLHAAHEAVDASGAPLGVVHRDVSPSNVHVGWDGRVKVLDFGIAVTRDRSSTTRVGEVKGKLAYLAPEQVRGQPIDRRVDVWAMGVMIWQLCARRWLFKGNDARETFDRILGQEIRPLAAVAPDVPPAVSEIVGRCLRRDRDERVSSCAEVARVLRAAAAELGGDERQLGTIACDLFAHEREAEATALRELPRSEDGISSSQVRGIVPHEQGTRTSPSAQVPTPRLSPPRALAALALLAAVAFAATWLAVPPPSPSAPTPASGATAGSPEAPPAPIPPAPGGPSLTGSPEPGPAPPPEARESDADGSEAMGPAAAELAPPAAAEAPEPAARSRRRVRGRRPAPRAGESASEGPEEADPEVLLDNPY
jgi:serine/threonine protein kinase